MSRWKVSIIVATVVLAVVEIGYVALRDPKEFVFTPRQAGLWALVILLLFALVIDTLVSMGQGAPPAPGPPNPPNPPAAPGPGGPPNAPAPADPTAAAAVTSQRRRGIKALIIGSDGRASTSKFQAVMWTAAVLYALTFLLLVGRIVVRPDDCGAEGQKACTPYGGIFDEVINQELAPEYFALLGFPLAAALAAKALVTNKVADGELLKPPSTSTGVATGAAELISADNGTIDVLDFQYTAFNLLTLLYFFTRLASDFEQGLPKIPATLLALSGVSVSAYTTKKALEKSVGPQVTAVSPPSIMLAQTDMVIIVGSGFTSAAGATTDLNGVFLDGKKLQTAAGDWTSTRVKAALPINKDELKRLLFRERSDPTALADLIVYDESGMPSSPSKIKIEVPPDWDT